MKTRDVGTSTVGNATANVLTRDMLDKAMALLSVARPPKPPASNFAMGQDAWGKMKNNPAIIKVHDAAAGSPPSFFGLKLILDHTLPPNEWELRDDAGHCLGRGTL